MRRPGGRSGLPGQLKPQLGEPAEVTRVAEPGHTEVREAETGLSRVRGA